MKTSCSVLAVMAMFAMAALNVPGALADQTSTDATDRLHTSQPVGDEKASWAPIRALTAMDSRQQQGPTDSDKKKHHQRHHGRSKKDVKETPRALVEEEVQQLEFARRALGQAPLVTPASTPTGDSKVTPAPTKPKATPAATATSTSKVTPAPTKPKPTPATTTSSSSKKTPAITPCHSTHKPKATPTATKKTPAPSATKPKPTPTAAKSTATKTTPTPTAANKSSNPIQQKTRNLRGDDTKQQQQLPHDLKHAGKHDGKLASKGGEKKQ